MSRNNVWVIIACIVAMVIVIVVNQGSRTENDPKVGQLLLPSLKPHLNEVEKVVIKDASSITTLEKQEETWVIAEKYRLEARMSHLSSVLNTLADSKILEKKTRKAKNFASLGVAEEGTKIQIFTAEHAYVVLVGHSGSKHKGQFVRLLESDDDQQVWLTNPVITVSADPISWLENTIINIEAESVEEISIIQSTSRLDVSRQDDQLEIADMPEELELKYSTIVDSLGRGLANLRFDDVVPIDEVDFTAASEASFGLIDGSRISLQIVEVAGKYWLKLMDHDRSNWAFEVSKLTYDNLTKTLADLTQEKQVES